jgi:hypothetical protein
MAKTMADLISETERRLRGAERAQADADREIRTIREGTARAGRDSTTGEETLRIGEALGVKRQAADEVATLGAQLADLRECQERDRELERGMQERKPGAAAPKPYDRAWRIGTEERTYRPDRDRTGRGFLLDVARSAMFSDVQASERLGRHMQEEAVERGDQLTRAVGTGAFTGLVVPQYLTDLYAPAAAALRPTANIANRHELPEQGMSLQISRITTASGVALQATENTAVQNTDMDDTLLTIPVQTAAGQQTISRQAVERGTGIEDVTMSDLFRRCATTLDNTLINQASTGLTNTAQVTAYTDGTPTAPELWPTLYQAQSKLESALLGQAVPDFVVMHSRRWNWLASQVTTSWPFLGSTGVPPQQSGVVLSNDYATTGVRGVLANGLKVIVDNNIATNLGAGTNEDEMFVVASGELHLWEDPNAPMLIRAEQAAAATLGVLLVVYSYFAYTAQRYGNNPGKVGGTGLIAPAGF